MICQGMYFARGHYVLLEKKLQMLKCFFLGLGTYIKGMYHTSLMKCLFGSPKHYLYSLLK
jgi:hypothetical protein